MKQIPLMISVALGTTLAGLTLTSQAASAFTLEFDGNTKPTSYAPKLFEAEIRAGVKGTGDYEGTIGPEGATKPNAGSVQINWQDANPYNWTLTWNPSTAIARFTLNGQTLTWNASSYLTDPSLRKWNALGLVARAKTQDGKVDPGTSINLTLTEVNNQTIDYTDGTNPYTFSGLSAIAPGTAGLQDLQQIYFSANPLSNTITRLEGTVSMDWDTLNPNAAAARSLLYMEIKAYDPPVPQVASVPEPASILGILSIGVFGATSALKRKKDTKIIS
jgi:hypothetical protein